MPIQFETKKKNMVLLPEEMLKSRYTGPIYGQHIEETGVFNIVSRHMAVSSPRYFSYLGQILDESTLKHVHDELVGEWIGEQLVFSYRQQQLEIKGYDCQRDIFSRNSGMVKLDKMETKSVVIIGAGSVNSKLALEMARTGVGHFLVIDLDMVEYSNIGRSEYHIGDVGKYKVTAIAEKIKMINPQARVQMEKCIVEDMPYTILESFIDPLNTVIVAGADNRSANAYGNDLAIYHGIPFVAIGCWEHCFAGEIFYWIPHRSMPCYRGVVGDDGQWSPLTGVSSTNRSLYISDENEKDPPIQPGLSIDITGIVSKGSQLAIDLMHLYDKNYEFKILPDMNAFTLCFNSKNVNLASSQQREMAAWLLEKASDYRVSFKAIDCESCQRNDKCFIR